MKKIWTSLISLFIILILSFNTLAAEGVIKDGRTFVPVRGVFETLGFNVSWDPSTNKATISDGRHDVSVIKDMKYFRADGKEIYPDVPQQVINNSLYLPLRAIGDAIGADISWNSETKTAHISYNNHDVYVKCNVINTNYTAANKTTASTPSRNTSSYSSNKNSVSSNTANTYSMTYIVNTNTGKFHYPTCSSVSEINPSNKAQYNGTREELIKMGYSPCKRCDP